MKTNELTGAALDWAVAKCEGNEIKIRKGCLWIPTECYSTDWAEGGPIIEREGILLDQYHDFPNWAASCPPKSGFNRFGPTPLIAAMRCYVASKLGDTVEVPIELN